MLDSTNCAKFLIPTPPLDGEGSFGICWKLLDGLAETVLKNLFVDDSNFAFYCEGDIAAYPATVRVPGQHTSNFFIVLCEAHKNAKLAKTETAQTGGNDD